jgi:hypothetical protein
VVQVRDTAGRAVPVKLRNVKTGRHTLCTDTSDDLRLPAKASWCELINWVSLECVCHSQNSCHNHHLQSVTQLPLLQNHGTSKCMCGCRPHLELLFQRLTQAAAWNKAPSNGSKSTTLACICCIMRHALLTN